MKSRNLSILLIILIASYVLSDMVEQKEEIASRNYNYHPGPTDDENDRKIL